MHSYSEDKPQRQTRPEHKTCGTARCADRRPEATALARLQALANASRQVSRLQALQACAEASPGVIKNPQRTNLAQNRSIQLQEPVKGEEARREQFAVTRRSEIDRGEMPMLSDCSSEIPHPPAGSFAERNETGLPRSLKAGIEALSGISMDNVRVHYNSSMPAQLNARAYAQGTDIHLAPGQERCLPHEAWHVVQQAQGRVKPTMQLVAASDQAIAQEYELFAGETPQTVLQGLFGCFPWPRRNRVERPPSRTGSEQDEHSTILIAGDQSKSATPPIDAVETKKDEFIPEPGPKAGFEFEYKEIWLINQSKLTPFHKKELKRTDKCNLGFIKKRGASYRKGYVAFCSPNLTWEGQADTSTEWCSDFEIVTKPISLSQWRHPDIKADYEAFKAFIKKLDSIEYRTLTDPKELHEGLVIKDTNARLYKHLAGSIQAPLVHETSATPIVQGGIEPEWWIDELNWDAAPYIKSIADSLSEGLGSQSNIKECFSWQGMSVLIKTPIKDLLGKSNNETADEQKKKWVAGMLDYLKRKPDEPVVGQVVEQSRDKERPKYDKNYELALVNFNWEEYLSELLSGNDLLTEWAKKALQCKIDEEKTDEPVTENVGLGQISDPSLGEGRKAKYVVLEYRQKHQGNTNYLEMGQSWAKLNAGHTVSPNSISQELSIVPSENLA